MDIAFNLLVYTNARCLEEWVNPATYKPPLPQRQEANLAEVNYTSIIVYTLLVLIGASFLGYTNPDDIPQIILWAFIFFLIGIGIFNAFHTDMYENRTVFVAHDKVHRYQHFGEIIRFSAKDFQIKSDMAVRNCQFSYTEIRRFTIQYKAEIILFKWEKDKTLYEYFISAYTSREDIIKFLQFLTKQHVTFKEINERGAVVSLLATIEKPQEETPLPEIDEKYQRLIDEIGEKDA